MLQIVKNVNELLKELYDNFYENLPEPQLTNGIIRNLLKIR